MGIIVNRNVELLSDKPGRYSVDVKLPPDSTLTIVCDTF